ncbi:MAG: flotillin family protein [Cyanobacteria bacterium]|nr:flotillin family protein [Cyanobacteriota bacterium]
MEHIEIVTIGLVFVVGFFLLSTIMRLYQKVGPNEAMLISGAVRGTDGHRFKVVQGGGTVVLPLVQKVDILSLEVMTIDVRTNAPIITKSGVPIFVEGVAQVKVEGEANAIATAAEQFLGKDTQQIASIAHETLVGHLRAILGTMEVEELIQSFESFAQRVQEVSINDLAKMGLTVVAFTINEIRDEVGYIENLGRHRTAEGKRNADIGVAEKTKETVIAQAQAQSESSIVQSQKSQEASKAKIHAETEIAEAAKEHEVKKALYQAEVAKSKAVSDLAYDIVKAQSEQKLIEEQKKIRIIEAQKQVELQQVEVMQKQVQLQAEVTKPAEAEMGRVRIYAQAEKEKVRLIAEADSEAAKLRAAGEAEALKMLAQAEAEAIRLKGLAEATVIGAKGQAEAEAMHRKAEALRQYNDAALSSMIIDKLPDIVSAAASPLSKIGSMTVLATGGDSGGASRITNDVLNVTAQSLTLVKGLTGIDLTSKLKSTLDSEPAKSMDSTKAAAMVSAPPVPVAPSNTQVQLPMKS